MIVFWIALVVFASIGVVAWPLVRGIGDKNGTKLVEDIEVSETLAQKDAALLAINELESDYEMGNLSQDDYRELRKKYEEQAVALLKTVDDLRSERALDTANHIDEEIEARVSRIRGARRARAGAAADACPGCGAPVQADDMFCSGCGSALGTKCPGCSAAVSAVDRFCFRCGATLDPVTNK